MTTTKANRAQSLHAYVSVGTAALLLAFSMTGAAEPKRLPLRIGASAFAALGYDSIMLVANAIERTGSAKQKDLPGALEGTHDFPGVTGSISFARGEHQPDKDVTIVRIAAEQRILAAVIRPQRAPLP